MAAEKICPECKTKFDCCNDPEGSGGMECWCSKLPNVIPLTEGAECLCEKCLEEKIHRAQKRENDSKAW